MKYHFPELFVLCLSQFWGSHGFVSSWMTTPGVFQTTRRPDISSVLVLAPTPATAVPTVSSLALHVWFFGGSASEESTHQDSCELVAVRIERPTPNSRKILGEIVVPCPMDDVWAILTDYNRLSTHVPNLVESKIVSTQTRNGEPGDGSYRCRLFQRGAQTIVGFEFGASVTMDMREEARDWLLALPPSGRNGGGANSSRPVKRERVIDFKCVESFFFDGFDGQWKVEERFNAESGEVESLLSYVVDVRPKGPVPVAALEWRIREDVPTNLRAIKKAAMEVGSQGVNALKMPRRVSSSPLSVATTAAGGTVNGRTRPTGRAVPAMRNVLGARRRQPAQSQEPGMAESNSSLSSSSSSPSSSATTTSTTSSRRKLEKVWVQWEESETMAAYLDKPSL